MILDGLDWAEATVSVGKLSPVCKRQPRAAEAEAEALCREDGPFNAPESRILGQTSGR